MHTMLKQTGETQIPYRRKDRRKRLIMADAVVVVCPCAEQVGNEGEEDGEAVEKEEVSSVIGVKIDGVGF
jgi:hypothetical protein